MSNLFHLQAIDALGAGDLRAFLCTDGKTFGLSIKAEVKSDGLLGSCCGYGADFNEALLDLFKQLTELPKGTDYIVLNSGALFDAAAPRRAVRWNGAGWKPVQETQR